MKYGKKQLVMASLVLALGAAVYLSWQFSGSKLPIDTGASESSELGAAQLVNNAYIETTGDDMGGADGTEAAAQTISEARLTRQSSRDEAIELLEGILSNSEEDSAAKEEAVSQTSAIAQNILKETNVENLLSAKGYKDSIVFINEDQCSVVVSGDIVDADTLIIQEIVVEQSGLTAEKIKIIGTK